MLGSHLRYRLFGRLAADAENQLVGPLQKRRCAASRQPSSPRSVTRAPTALEPDDLEGLSAAPSSPRPPGTLPDLGCTLRGHRVGR